MSTVTNQDWLNQNSQRNYPIKEGSSRFDVSNAFRLPNQLIVDAVFTLNDVTKKFYVKSVFFVEEKIIIDIFDSEEVFVSSITIDVNTHQAFDSYIVLGKNQYKFLQGKIVVGDLSQLSQGNFGKTEFSFDSTAFVDSVMVPSLRGVSSLGNDIGDQVLVGDIVIKAGFNIKVRVEESENAIYIDAIEGEGLGPFCPCDEEEDVPFVQTINGIAPNEEGDFALRGVDCIELVDQATGLSIQDNCSSACCECDDVNALRDILDQKDTQIADLNARVLSLENCP